MTCENCLSTLLCLGDTLTIYVVMGATGEYSDRRE
jgi:hypothetical protein